MNKFKDTFDLEKAIAQLEDNILALSLTKAKNAIRAQQAIDQFSVAVLKKQSIFSRAGNEMTCNTSFDAMHIEMKKPLLK